MVSNGSSHPNSYVRIVLKITLAFGAQHIPKAFQIAARQMQGKERLPEPISLPRNLIRGNNLSI